MVATLIPPDEPGHGPYCDADLRHDGCVCVEKADLEEHARQVVRELSEQFARQRRASGMTADELRQLFGGR